MPRPPSRGGPHLAFSGCKACPCHGDFWSLCRSSCLGGAREVPGNCFHSSCPPQSHLRAEGSGAWRARVVVPTAATGQSGSPGPLHSFCPRPSGGAPLIFLFLGSLEVYPLAPSSPWAPWPSPVLSLGASGDTQALARLVQPHAFSPQPGMSPRDGCPGASGGSCPSLLQDERMAAKNAASTATLDLAEAQRERPRDHQDGKHTFSLRFPGCPHPPRRGRHDCADSHPWPVGSRRGNCTRLPPAVLLRPDPRSGP